MYIIRPISGYDISHEYLLYIRGSGSMSLSGIPNMITIQAGGLQLYKILSYKIIGLVRAGDPTSVRK